MTGNGLKDPDTALRDVPTVTPLPVDAGRWSPPWDWDDGVPRMITLPVGLAGNVGRGLQREPRSPASTAWESRWAATTI